MYVKKGVRRDFFPSKEKLERTIACNLTQSVFFKLGCTFIVFPLFVSLPQYVRLQYFTLFILLFSSYLCKATLTLLYYSLTQFSGTLFSPHSDLTDTQTHTTHIVQHNVQREMYVIKSLCSEYMFSRKIVHAVCQNTHIVVLFTYIVCHLTACLLFLCNCQREAAPSPIQDN